MPRSARKVPARHARRQAPSYAEALGYYDMALTIEHMAEVLNNETRVRLDSRNAALQEKSQRDRLVLEYMRGSLEAQQQREVMRWLERGNAPGPGPYLRKYVVQRTKYERRFGTGARAAEREHPRVTAPRPRSYDAGVQFPYGGGTEVVDVTDKEEGTAEGQHGRGEIFGFRRWMRECLGGRDDDAMGHNARRAGGAREGAADARYRTGSDLLPYNNGQRANLNGTRKIVYGYGMHRSEDESTSAMNGCKDKK